MPRIGRSLFSIGLRQKFLKSFSRQCNFGIVRRSRHQRIVRTTCNGGWGGSGARCQAEQCEGQDESLHESRHHKPSFAKGANQKCELFPCEEQLTIRKKLPHRFQKSAVQGLVRACWKLISPISRCQRKTCEFLRQFYLQPLDPH